MVENNLPIDDIAIEDLAEVTAAATLGTASTVGCPFSSASTAGSH
ncbi:thiocillin family RiPP [Nonomuraea sp. NPDC000554]